MDLQSFYMGEAFDAYNFFGAHIQEQGVVFRTYAPNAAQITITGEFNNWTEQPMRQQGRSGVFEVFSQQAQAGQMYKYCVYGKNGRVEHCDPYGFGMELRPGCCSVIRDLNEYKFTDGEWMSSRTRCYDKPLNIYELHIGSWKIKPEGRYSYDELAPELIEYLKKHNYNCVEFLPLSEHPFDGSWGYQNTGFFSPTSRFGTAAQLMSLVDSLHNAGIGAIMDFVPVHFAVDSYGLKQFDGSELYEYPNSDVGESEWGSCNFMHSRREVCSFLQSAANYWLSEYHFDGLRMDAVSRLIYWQGDESRGENGNAVNFIKVMNKGLHRLHPTAMLIAEDSTNYGSVTKPVEQGGLGFDYKWDLGWMNDTLEYMKAKPFDRIFMRNTITFSMLYYYNERYLLPFSHDETVHGKKTIIDKISGGYEEKFAQAKTLYLYMYAHPGKKLNFAGNELAMFREWDETREPDWDLLKFPAHDSFNKYIRTLNRIYEQTAPLFCEDYDRDGFEWLDSVSPNSCVFAFLRRGEGETVLTLLNFSDSEAEISIGDALTSSFNLLINTDWQQFGGKTPQKEADAENFIKALPPFSGVLYKL